MTDIPPPRYRIVERGRRLEVTDMWQNGARPAHIAYSKDMARPSPGKLTALPRLRTVKFDGTSELTTARWFDDKGPRHITLSGETLQPIWVFFVLGMVALVAVAIFVPALLLAVAAVGSAKTRATARSIITGWLDRNGT